MRPCPSENSKPAVFKPIEALLPIKGRRSKDAEHVLLCHQQADSDGFQMTPTSNRSLASFLSSRLSGDRFRLSVLDFHSRATPLDMFEQIACISPDLVGLSCYVWNTHAMFRLCQLLQQQLPATTIVLGGPQLHYDQEDLRRWTVPEPLFDLLVQGEGELALLEYLTAPANFRPGRGTVVNGAPLGQLDHIGAPIQQNFPPSRQSETMMYLEGARGCQYQCGYCANCLPGRPIRAKSLSLIERELAWARRNHTKLIMYGYSSINMPPKKALPRLHAIANSGLDNTVHHVFAIDYQTIEEEEIATISGINAVVDIGVQSINPVALHLAHRVFKKERLEKVLGWCKKHGLMPTLEIIIGLPGDTLIGTQATLDYLGTLDFPIMAAPLVLLPGSTFYFRRHDLELQYDPKTYQLLSSATMTEKDLQNANRLARDAMRKNPSSPFDVAVRKIHPVKPQ